MSDKKSLHPGDDRQGRPVRCLLVGLIAVLTVLPYCMAQDKTGPAETTEEKVQRLTEAVRQAQEQMESYQALLANLQQQLAALQQQLAGEKKTVPVPSTSVPSSTARTNSEETANPAQRSGIEEIRERQAIEESEIATHDQTKVETESKYPLQVTGLLLFNAYVNTHRVDVAANPTYALAGSGSTGFSLRQTVLGLDARGPHLFGASSSADVRVDFFADGTQSSYTASGLLRLRTAHAQLKWRNVQAFVEMDRSLLAPNIPSSLVAVSQPDFAWSGDLWTWNPQIGLSYESPLSGHTRLRLQAALIDVADSQLPSSTTSTSTISMTERSRWPGTEVRIALTSGDEKTGPEFGIGGYFSPHETSDNVRFNALAGTLDMRLPIGRYFAITGNAYRGKALGGLGGGGYVDYFYQYVGTTEFTRPLDDVGGWIQLKSKLGERVEINTGYGIDNPFSGEINNRMALPGTAAYAGLGRNRSAVGNVIYSPSAYLLFSLEYRRLWTNYAASPTQSSDVIGIGAGYRF